MIELRVLGSTSLKGPSGNELHSVLARPKLLGLLTVLASAPGPGFLRRDTLLGLLWTDSDPERARATLRQSVYNLRQALGSGSLESRGEEEIRLVPEEIWSDMGTFKRAMDEGRLEEGLELYRGDLLEGFFLPNAPEFERWLEGERGRLRELAASGAWKLAETAKAQANPAGVGHWVRKALVLSPFDEALLRQGMTLLAEVGDRSGAIQAHEAFSRRIRSELEMEPAPETDSLARGIAKGDREGAGRRTVDPAPSPESEAPSDPVAEPADGPEVLPGSKGETRPRNDKRWKWIAVLAAVVVGTLFVSEIWRTMADPSSPVGLGDRELPTPDSATMPPNVLAVLPFDSHTAEEGTDELAAGIHEEVRTHLSRIPDFTVISRRSVEQYARTDLTLQEIAQRLGAGSVLEGSVQMEEGRVKVSVQLIDAVTDGHLWAESFIRNPRDLMELQLEIAMRVTATLREELAGTPEDTIGAP